MTAYGNGEGVRVTCRLTRVLLGVEEFPFFLQENQGVSYASKFKLMDRK